MECKKQVAEEGHSIDLSCSYCSGEETEMLSDRTRANSLRLLCEVQTGSTERTAKHWNKMPRAV